jgi:hypothetical protein
MYFQPENIVCSGRNGESIKIIDFGTAMQLTSGQQEQLFLINMSMIFCYMIKDAFFICFKKGLWYVVSLSLFLLYIPKCFMAKYCNNT